MCTRSCKPSTESLSIIVEHGIRQICDGNSGGHFPIDSFGKNAGIYAPSPTLKSMADSIPTAVMFSRGVAQRVQRRRSGLWLQWFVVFLLATQIPLLFLDQIAAVLGAAGGPLRVLLRTVPYLGSLLLLFLIPGRALRHPATLAAIIVLVIMGVSWFHPTTNSPISGTAQAVLYLAILAPLFWVPRLQIDLAIFRRVVLILWGFHTISAAVGILQVYFPGQFQPSLSTALLAQGEVYVESLQMTTASGQQVFRPMGLTDHPGGAAVAGFNAVLFGMGFLLIRSQPWMKLGAVGSMAVGLAAIYLSQVRSTLVLTIVCVLVFAAALAVRGRMNKVAVLLPAVVGVAVLSFAWAVALGGASVLSRLATLTEDSPTEVYQSNRGHFLTYTFNYLLPEYPLGAGLGRWGMMNTYFGDNSDPDRAVMWVEIQWTGWLLDGGAPLILAYVAALLAAVWTMWRISGMRNSAINGEGLSVWGALLFAYNIGVIAVTFNYPIFTGTGGMEFWMLNAALFTAAAHAGRTERAARRVSRPGSASEVGLQFMPDGRAASALAARRLSE